MEMADPASLNPSAYNPRKITPQAFARLRKSFAKHGFVDPVQVRKADDSIIGGHQRVKAAIAEGLKAIPVVRLDLTEKEAKLLNLSLNASYGTVDVPKLSLLLKDLQITGADLDLTGLAPSEIAELTSAATAAIAEIDLRSPPTVSWILLGIPFDRFAEAADPLAALQAISAVSVQSNRD